MQSKVRLLQGFGIVMLAIVQTIAVTTIDVDKTITNILVYMALAIIAITWIVQFALTFSKSVKVIKHQVHSSVNEKTGKLETVVFLTFISNTSTSIDKVIWLNIPKALQQRVQTLITFPLGFSLARYQPGQHIFLDQGKATQLNDEQKLSVQINAETKPLLKELCNRINWNLDYSISYKTFDKSYTFLPSLKEKRRKRETGNELQIL